LSAQRADRRGLDDLLDQRFPDGFEEPVFAAEVVVDLRLVGLGGCGDPVNPGSRPPLQDAGAVCGLDGQAGR